MKSRVFCAPLLKGIIQLRMVMFFFILAFLPFVTSCQTYQFAKSLKYYGFSEEPVKGQPQGPARGQACTWMLMGYWLGGPPRLSDALDDMYKSKNSPRYIVNLSSENDGFSLGFIGRTCTIIRGMAFK